MSYIAQPLVEGDGVGLRGERHRPQPEITRPRLDGGHESSSTSGSAMLATDGETAEVPNGAESRIQAGKPRRLDDETCRSRCHSGVRQEKVVRTPIEGVDLELRRYALLHHEHLMAHGECLGALILSAYEYDGHLDERNRVRLRSRSGG